MPWLRVGFLLFVLSVSCGYRFRCYMFCTDQSAIQHDYIEQRDRCRNYAELKLDMSLRGIRGPIDGKSRKTELVNLFNSCMAENGWNIAPDVTDAKAAPAAAAMPQQPQQQAPVQAAQVQEEQMMQAHREKAALSRSAECMFARHAAEHSSIAAARAQACDLECAQRLRASPEAPRPAACPSDVEPNVELIHGGERIM